METGALSAAWLLKRQMDVRLDDDRLKLFVVGGEHFGKQATAGAYGVGDIFGRWMH